MSRFTSVAMMSDLAYDGRDFDKWPLTRDARYIGKCGRCKTPRSVLVPLTLMKHDYRMGQVGGQMWSQVSFGYELHFEGRNVLRALTCGECGSDDMRMKPVKGTLNESVKCDARCMNAKGPNCECSCKGANHGAGWGS